MGQWSCAGRPAMDNSTCGWRPDRSGTGPGSSVRMLFVNQETVASELAGKPVVRWRRPVLLVGKILLVLSGCGWR